MVSKQKILIVDDDNNREASDPTESDSEQRSP